MTRRERRIKHRRVRRVMASATALGMVGLGVGLAVPAGAQNYHVQNDGPGATLQGNYNCTGDTWGDYHAQNWGQGAWHSC